MPSTFEDFLVEIKQTIENPVEPNSDLKIRFEKSEKDLQEAILAVKGKTEAEVAEIKKKWGEDFKKSCDEIQKSVQDQLDKQKESITGQIAAFEAEIKTKVDFKKSEDSFKTEAFRKFLYQGVDKLSDAEKQQFVEFAKATSTITTSNNVTGGFLVPRGDIIKIIAEKPAISDLMNYVTRDTIGQISSQIPVIKDNKATAKYYLELEESGVIEMAVEQVIFTLQAIQVSIPVTVEYLESALEPERTIGEKAIQADRRRRNLSILYGKGLKSPQGIYNFISSGGSSGFESFESVDKGKIQLTDLKKLWAADGIGVYRANSKWFMSTEALAELRFETGTDGAFKWTTDIREGIPLQLNGQPVVEIYEMPGIEVNKMPVIYGDLSAAYMWVENNKAHFIRDDFTEAYKRIVKFTWFSFVDGKCIEENALKLLKVKAA